jgi:ADP-ribosylglycohydrolase
MPRLERALTSLEGLSVGDAFGERFFVSPATVEQVISARAMPREPWRYTDDTVMALSVVEVLAEHGRIDQDALMAAFARRWAAEPDRGYGGGAHHLLQRCALGESWREVAPALFPGGGSMGNGGAMRVAPLGAFFADDLDRAAEEARRSAEVTHAHPEGQAGAIAVAVSAAWVCSAEASGSGAEVALWDAVLDLVPPGETRAGVERARALGGSATVEAAAAELGTGSRVLAQDTVPFSLWCAARHLDDFVEAMWTTVSGLGDRDTTCAIAGGIVACAVGAEGIPADWRSAREPLPLEPRA